jgi:hypothetical protein
MSGRRRLGRRRRAEGRRHPRRGARRRGLPQPHGQRRAGDLRLGRHAGRHRGGAGRARRRAAPGRGEGVYLHGRAGDRLARRIGPLGYLARELLAEVPALMVALGRPPRRTR